ncbi:MAG: radical SAM protein [Desulfovibrio sp.]|nr:radical SAM protein [Desulfovibrio sp.]
MIIRRTESLCPVCLRRLDASYEQEGEIVYLRKQCPEHGYFSTEVWRNDTGMDWAHWQRPKFPSYPKNPTTAVQDGCPFDCGLCPEHGQHTCTGLLEITRRCNMACPICYAQAGEGTSDLDFAEIDRRLESLRRLSGSCNLQISGGEPTVREDLPDCIALAASKGFGLVQLNTNGLRLGREAGYAQALAQAGLESVYLQWDSLRAETWRRLRGEDYQEIKLKALRSCLEAGLGVVLVATVIRTLNDGELGDLLRFALQEDVRGLHLQPAAFFGRYPWSLAEAPRLTLPELLAALTSQAPDLVSREDVHPPGCEHELCSLSAVYIKTKDKKLKPLGQATSCSCRASDSQTPPLPAFEGARAARAFTARHWKGVGREMPNKASQEVDEDKNALAFDRFLARAGVRQRFTLSAMAFQDALSLDVQRVRGCCIHVLRKNDVLMPFCLHNLTSQSGIRLYPL